MAIAAVIGTAAGGWILTLGYPSISLIQAAIYVGVVTILANQAQPDDQ